MSYNTNEAAKKILGLRSRYDNQASQLRQKVNKIYGNESENTYNPFLNKSGKLFNPYINYQAVLDNPNVTQTAKSFIARATGLTPTKIMPASGTDIVTTDTNFSEKTEAFQNSAPVTSAQGGSIADSAKKYIGTPYVWGGESMSEGGMDCSGFVYNALKDAGYNVGRTTAQGYRSYGKKVSKSDMQAGDLIFFGKDNASHIGIYLGNGQMIHSAGGRKNTKSNPGKGVSITNVDYRNDFIEARRY